MLFCALATDYDGTLACDGKVDDTTLAALRDFKASGKRLILITGRELPDLRSVFGACNYFDAVVAENGALLYLPASQEERLLGASPPERLVAALRAKGVNPLSVGRGIIATWSPNEGVVLDAIRELGLDWQLVFNKGAVMCLPPGVNKGSGLAAALDELKLSAHNVVGIGDAENDQAFLSACGCAVAVANALDTVKENADIRTNAERGAGVSELIARWLADAAHTFSDVRRHDIRLGESIDDGTTVSLPSDRGAVLIAGSSGVGKTTLTRLLIERMLAGAYQVCIVDPEGDYDNLDDIAHLGDPKRAPAPEEVLNLLDSPRNCVVVNLLGVDVADRPMYFSKLLGQLSGLRVASGRPHWLVLDETHHLSPNTQDVQAATMPANLSSVVFITTRPKNLSPSALRLVGALVGLGKTAPQVLSEFCAAVGESCPAIGQPVPDDAVMVWNRTASRPPLTVAVGKAKQAHQRHTRKYAEGRLGEDISFYFRGPANALNLRAFNLATFLQLARGVDDETWLYHLGRGDYTRWFLDVIKDDELAAEARLVESDSDPQASRSALEEAVKRRYAAANID